MPVTAKITAPDHPALPELCRQLEELAPMLDDHEAWPAIQLELCGRYGVYEWFIDPQYGGQGWSDVDIIRGYLQLSRACLTTTFVITQRMGACRRIAIAPQNELLRDELLPHLLAGGTFATVGISHLTTSRRHLGKPVLTATQTDEGFRLDGFSPWVTGAKFAQTIVIGATLEDGRQILLAMPTDLPGVSASESAQLVGVSASQTGPLRLDQVHVDQRWLLAGPVENVMQQGIGAKSGGLQTSTLALGVTLAAIDFIEREATNRPDLAPPVEALRKEWSTLYEDLLAAAEGDERCSNEELRTRANSLVLRASQASLAAAKGAGYVIGHPAGRWCREALFFLVWSCPQPVMSANLCELAGILA